jgi:glycosyltransferase involved in cell wall biosynthesis
MSDSYYLITAAKNEESFIANTIQSVVKQTIQPTKWIIVSDGSTDRTNQIVEDFKNRYDFIDLIALPPNKNRNFSSKVNALNLALEHYKDISTGFIGNLDADITLEPNYYEKVLSLLNDNPKLGIVGGIIIDCIDGKELAQNISLNSVAGAIQLFRINCFQDVGGYLPFKYGGEDAYMEIKARMHGWDVQTVPYLRVLHHRRTGTGMGSLIHANIRKGKMFYTLGYQPLFYLVRTLYRIIDKPYFIGSFLNIYGYTFAALKGEGSPADKDFINFVRNEQKGRLRSMLPFQSKKQVVKTSRMINL